MAGRPQRFLQRRMAFGVSGHAQWRFPEGSEPEPGSEEQKDFERAVIQGELVDRLLTALADRREDLTEEDAPPGGVRRMKDVISGRLRWMEADTHWLTTDMGVPYPTPEEIRGLLRRAHQSAREELETEAAKQRRAEAVARAAARRADPEGHSQLVVMPGVRAQEKRPSGIEGEDRVAQLVLESVRALATQFFGHDPSAGYQVEIDMEASTDYYPYPDIAADLELQDDSWISLSLQSNWLRTIGTQGWATIEGRLVGRVLETEHGLPTRVSVLHIARDPRRLNWPAVMFVPVDILSETPVPIITSDPDSPRGMRVERGGDTVFSIDPDSPGLHDPFGVLDEQQTAWLRHRNTGK